VTRALHSAHPEAASARQDKTGNTDLVEAIPATNFLIVPRNAAASALLRGAIGTVVSRRGADPSASPIPCGVVAAPSDPQRD